MVIEMPDDTGDCLERLKQWLARREKLAVAFSGGVDSSVVLAAAIDALGAEAVVAVTGDSESLPASELADASALASSLGVRHELIETRELLNESYTANPPDRCYYCKREFWSEACSLAAGQGISCLVDGTNADDIEGHRPGQKACKEAGVLHPLVEVGAGKGMVRSMAIRLDLPNWDKPAQACLSSRFPYGTALTAKGLGRVEAAEELLDGLGFRQLRVRDHGGLARIEVPLEELDVLVAHGGRGRIVEGLKQLGYDYVTVDLEGFRSGSMNEVLEDDGKD